MAIENRNLAAGTRLVARYHKQLYHCTVVEGEGGKLRFRLEDGREFKSLSAAGMAITGGACNGWAFWSIETDTPATQTPETQQEPSAIQATGTAECKVEKTEAVVHTPTQTTEEPLKKSPFFRTPNQKSVPEGQTRWYCRECGQSFLATKGETPESCPKGHKAS